MKVKNDIIVFQSLFRDFFVLLLIIQGAVLAELTEGFQSLFRDFFVLRETCDFKVEKFEKNCGFNPFLGISLFYLQEVIFNSKPGLVQKFQSLFRDFFVLQTA